MLDEAGEAVVAHQLLQRREGRRGLGKTVTALIRTVYQAVLNIHACPGKEEEKEARIKARLPTTAFCLPAFHLLH